MVSTVARLAKGFRASIINQITLFRKHHTGMTGAAAICYKASFIKLYNQLNNLRVQS